jgi:S-adenosylmethionine:tRNA ribosyltransferase-isomerase
VKQAGSINISEYNYDLPDDRIAKYPLEQRDQSKLLYYKNGLIETYSFQYLPEILNSGHHLVFNDTKVIQARLLFEKTSGAGIEILLLEPWLPAEYLCNFEETSRVEWICMIGNLKKWKSGLLEKQILSTKGSSTLYAEITGEIDSKKIVAFQWNNPELCFSEILLLAGITPLPPYLNREAENTDKLRYQTIYSDFEGSVAAPTAGLHFTREIINKIEEKDISNSRITLHVGAGTFIPVKSLDALHHSMHAEHFQVSLNSMKELAASDKTIINVGTTSVRTMESLYWLGVKLYYGMGGSLNLEQWEAYDLSRELTRKQSMEALIKYMEAKNLKEFKSSTRIMIVPGYEFKMTDALITNFHQPKSTLLLLIAALIGADWRKIYRYALENNYRFLSYGDSSILFR